MLSAATAEQRNLLLVGTEAVGGRVQKVVRLGIGGEVGFKYEQQSQISQHYQDDRTELTGLKAGVARGQLPQHARSRARRSSTLRRRFEQLCKGQIQLRRYGIEKKHARIVGPSFELPNRIQMDARRSSERFLGEPQLFATLTHRRSQVTQ